MAKGEIPPMMAKRTMQTRDWCVILSSILDKNLIFVILSSIHKVSEAAAFSIAVFNSLLRSLKNDAHIAARVYGKRRRAIKNCHQLLYSVK